MNSTCVYHVYNHVYSNYSGKHLNPISLVYTKVVCSSKLIHIIGKSCTSSQQSPPGYREGLESCQAYNNQGLAQGGGNHKPAINSVSHQHVPSFPQGFFCLQRHPTQPNPPKKKSSSPHFCFRVKCPVRARGQRYGQITWHKAVRPLAS